MRNKQFFLEYFEQKFYVPYILIMVNNLRILNVYYVVLIHLIFQNNFLNTVMILKILHNQFFLILNNHLNY